MYTRGLFVGGRDVAATSGRSFHSINPATGLRLARVDEANDADVDAAVRDALGGFQTWAAMPAGNAGAC